MEQISVGDDAPTFQAVIFDFDGLLMDTETTLLQSWQYEWQQWGLTLSAAGFFAQHGGNIDQQRYDHLAQAVGPGYDRELSDLRRTRYRQHLHQTLPLRPGISDWIRSLIRCVAPRISNTVRCVFGFVRVETGAFISGYTAFCL